MTRNSLAISVFLCLLSLSPALFWADDPVVWTNVSGVSVTGSSLTKTGSTSAWDSGAASLNVFRNGYGFVEATATETNTERMIGLSNGDTDQNYTDIDFAVYLNYVGDVIIYESGTSRGAFGTYTSGDRFRVEVRYGVVRYLKNGSLFYTSGVNPKYPLRVDTSLKTPGATLTNVRFGNLVWANSAGVARSGDSLTKTASSGWNAGGSSTNTIESGDGFVEFTATETNTNRAAGFGSSDVDQTLSDLKFAIVLHSDATVEVSESGTSRGSFGLYAGGDRFRVECVGGTVRYYRNGSSFYTSTVTPTYPLRADTSLDTTGATITNLSLETQVWSISSGVSVQGANITKTAATGNWDGGATSTNTIASGDGWVEFTAIETTSRRVLGLKGNGSAQTYADINFAIDLTDNGVVQVQESGVLRGQFGSYSHGDRLRIEIQDGIVRYRRNGVLFYTSAIAPAYPLHAEASLYTNGSTFWDVAMGDLVWINDSRVQIFGRSLVANASVSGWDAGAVSTKQINSGYVEFTATDQNTERMIGLSHGDTNQNYTDIDFAIYLNYVATVTIYEAGTSRGAFGAYATGDRFRVEVQDNAVKYYRNGSLLYTSSVTPVLPLRVDTSVKGNGTGIFNVVLSGDAVIGQLDTPAVTPAGGQYNATQNVTISHWLSGTTIRYTLDGSDPTESSTQYSTPLVVDQTTTIKTKAWKSIYTPSNTRTDVYTMKVGTPSFSPGTGTYYTSPAVTISTVTSGATIRYTLDGSNPTDTSPSYSSPVTVDQSLTLKAKATRTGWIDSDIGSAAYTMKVSALTLSPGPGSYSGAQTVTVTTATPNVTFRYTTDGNELTTASPTFSGNTITMNHSVTLKIQGIRNGWADGDVTRGNYYISLGTVATPTLSPAAGTYTTVKLVTISTTTSGATIRYTVDGTEPTFASKVYAGPIPTYNTTEIRAKAFKADMTMSATVAGLYVIDTGAVDTPRASPGSGLYSSQQTVTVSTQTSGATIHYTTNGVDPAENDLTVASGGTITVDRSMTLKLKAWKSGVPTSNVAWMNYQITGATSVGGDHSLALKADGTVWSWGSNQWGALGRTPYGGTNPNATPAQVPITDVVAVAAGWLHSLAIKRDGTVWAWGYGYNGQVGPGSSTIAWSPIQVTGLTNIIAIAPASYHNLALKSDGTVWIWGSDTMVNSSTPVQVAGLQGVTQISAACNQSFVVKTDGEPSGVAWSWGQNEYGMLGDGTQTGRGAPVQVATLNDISSIEAAGCNHALALRRDGWVWSWGANNAGQLGGNQGNPRVAPGPAGLIVVPPLRTKFLAGESSSTLVMTRISIRNKPQVFGLGENGTGELGVGFTSFLGETQPLLNLMQDGVIITGAKNGHHAMAIHADGRLFSWGQNDYGKLGNGTTTNTSTPAAVPNFTIADNSWLLLDSDSDGLSNLIEMELGTDPTNPDTNGDGVPDGVALDTGTDPTNTDIDGDGLTNAKERELGTDPFRADTDGDGVADGTDCFPLDASRSQCPAPAQGDTMPPAITLTEPTNATLTGTNP